MFFAYKKVIGRTETRTRDRMYCQTIRTVRDISRDDRARIATCSLRTPTEIRRIIVQIVPAATGAYQNQNQKVHLFDPHTIIHFRNIDMIMNII